MRKGLENCLEDTKSKIDPAAREDNREGGDGDDDGLSKPHRQADYQEAYRFERWVAEGSAGGVAASSSASDVACLLRWVKEMSS